MLTGKDVGQSSPVGGDLLVALSKLWYFQNMNYFVMKAGEDIEESMIHC